MNADALQSDSPINIIMFGDTYTISRDSAKVRGYGCYTWFSSGDLVSNAILIVNGTYATGLIYTATKTCEILHVSDSIRGIYDLDMSRFSPVGSGQTDLTCAATVTPDRGLISHLESAYIGWQEYLNWARNTITTRTTRTKPGSTRHRKTSSTCPRGMIRNGLLRKLLEHHTGHGLQQDARARIKAVVLWLLSQTIITLYLIFAL